jgi:hypothetical protein
LPAEQFPAAQESIPNFLLCRLTVLTHLPNMLDTHVMNVGASEAVINIKQQFDREDRVAKFAL